MYDDSDVIRPSRARFLPYIFGGITGVSVALVIIAVMLLRGSNGEPADPQPAAYQAAGVPSSAGIDAERRSAIVTATEQVSPAVISITGLYRVRTRSVYDMWFNRYYPGRTRTQATQGSGFIIDSRGYAFTNYHVVRDAERIQVTLADGKEYAATLVGTAPTYDLALLKIDGDEFPAARLGDSDDLVVGEWAIAIGSPFGSYLADTQPTVTVGVISANHRDIKQDENSEQIFNDMIQTDAAINPGNSGGPLINAHGEVIGVNTIIFSSGTGANVGIGFAIPINRVRSVYEELVEHGRVRDVWVGMSATDITPQVQAALNLPAESGVLVQSIEEGGPADTAGLKAGDQIIAINGVKLQNRTHANRLIFGSGVGDTIEMTVNRKDELLNFRVTLAERPRDI
ncbi:MAG: trypsin-like peptidase domain-containing protein [Candidatus Krumholzibacteria bacterium]|nr:trypsin-like peptidase domain-containing protein [Candidatus Krumholzibacteria bacterium]MDH4336546.1 trypsin-like peptidase domain-containing protein [Candidatus Krumholzibacteria bacterium]MDH5269627.1 trypsin-like peptidase domain-containing protein [Candidatus Krumholzibacteria bacterium]